MATGTVRWFNDAKGFGFITPEEGGGKDVFVHHNAIASGGTKALSEGASVEFSIEQGLKGLQATSVKIV